MGSRDKDDSTYLIRNAPSDRVECPGPDQGSESVPPSGRWRTSNPPPGASPDSRWWPDPELGQAFHRWTSIPPARGDGGREAAVELLVDRLKTAGLSAVGTSPRRAPPVETPGLTSKIHTMVARLGRHGPNEEAADHRALLDLGEEALPTLQALFPGRLWFHRWEPHVRPPKGRNVSALCRTLVAFGAAAVPYIAELLRSPDDEVRYYATLVAAEIPDARLIEPISAALFDDDHGVSRSALRTLEVFEGLEALESVKQALRALAVSIDTNQRSRLLAMRALAVLRDETAVDSLIDALGEHSVLGEAAWRVLRMLTAQDFGNGSDAWRAWHEENRARSREEWLIESLDHDDEEIRMIAARDLARLSTKSFGYDPSLSRDARRAAQARYRQWWSSRR